MRIREKPLRSEEMAEKKINGFDEWEVKSDLDTLIRAKEIMDDNKKVKAIQQLMIDKKEATDEVAHELKVSKKLKKVLG